MIYIACYALCLHRIHTIAISNVGKYGCIMHCQIELNDFLSPFSLHILLVPYCVVSRSAPLQNHVVLVLNVMMMKAEKRVLPQISVVKLKI